MAPGEIDTPEVVQDVHEDTLPRQTVIADEDDEEYEDASDAG